MANDNPTALLLPPGRMLWGDPYDGQARTDRKGQPKLGADGKPTFDFGVGVAIPKNPGETHWAQTTWGAKIYALGQQYWGTRIGSDDFAWKIHDGDSTKANTKGKRPCDDENQRGCWIVKPGTMIPPTLCGPHGEQSPEFNTKGYVYPGCYVQVYLGSIKSNQSQETAGIYLNLQVVSFQAHGTRIQSSIATGGLGFGGAALPAGASATPVGGMSSPGVTAAVPNVPGAPLAVPGFPAPAMPAGLPGVGVLPTPAGLPALPGQVAAPAALPVAPNPAFTQLPTPPAALPVPPAPVPAYSMTASANGGTREQFHALGWTDEQLVAGGYMLRAPF